MDNLYLIRILAYFTVVLYISIINGYTPSDSVKGFGETEECNNNTLQEITNGTCICLGTLSISCDVADSKGFDSLLRKIINLKYTHLRDFTFFQHVRSYRRE